MDNCKNTRVSIVIPSYNRGHSIGRTLESIQKQTYKNWEAIVIDNHSQDNTDQVLDGFKDSRISLLKIHNNGVIAASRNAGIRVAEGKWIAFLDSDDWWMPEKLKVSMTYLNRGADLVYHDLYSVKKNKQRIHIRKARTRRLKTPVYVDLLVNGNALNNSSVVVRKQLLTSIDGLSEEPDLIAAEDYDAWLRIAKISEKFYKINETLGYYWAGGGNISNTERDLKIADAIEARYGDSGQFSGSNLENSWLNYTRGRAHFKLGCYRLAEKNLKNVQWNHTSFLIFLKAKWMLLAINLFH